MIDYFDYVTLRTKESDPLVKQLFNSRSGGIWVKLLRK